MGQETSPAYHDWRTRCEERGGAGWHSHAAVSSSLCAKHADGRVGGVMMSLLLTTWHRKLMFTQLDSTHTHTTGNALDQLYPLVSGARAVRELAAVMSGRRGRWVRRG